MCINLSHVHYISKYFINILLKKGHVGASIWKVCIYIYSVVIGGVAETVVKTISSVELVPGNNTWHYNIKYTASMTRFVIYNIQRINPRFGFFAHSYNHFTFSS